MGLYRDAWIDAVDARMTILAEHVEDATATLMPTVARVIAVAARTGNDPAAVADVGRLLDRHAALCTACLLDELTVYHDAYVTPRKGWRQLDPEWRLTHTRLRDSEIRARRKARAAAARQDGLAPRLDELRGGGRVPGLDKLGKMTDAELNLLLRRFGIARNRTELMSTAVGREAARLTGVTKSTEALRRQILDRAESAVRRNLMTAAKEAVRGYQEERLVKAGATGDTLLEWSAVGGEDGDERSCGDCPERHGEQRTKDEWEGDGPGSLNLQCNGNCRCELEVVD